jgi:protein-S-isoprenylcysteine O-methyltransferase Ste14
VVIKFLMLILTSMMLGVALYTGNTVSVLLFAVAVICWFLSIVDEVEGI